MKKKEFTEHQKNRLPDTKYLVEIFDSIYYKEISIVCIANGKCKYTREMFKLGDWATLLWTCCTTQKQIEKGVEDTTFEMYDSYEDMIEVHPEFDFGKAPNDL